MKKLLGKFALLTDLLVLTVVFLLCFAPKDQNNYLLVLLDKHRLLASTSSPRLIFIGGSNIAYGIDSTRIQKKTHLPVINMGLHAGMGLKFMLEDLQPYIRKGDIVIVIPEYNFFYGSALNGGADGTLTYLILNCTPKEIRYLDFGQFKALLQGFPSTLNQSVIRDENYVLKKPYNTPSISAYRRDGFNQNGDVIAHLTMKSQLVSPPVASNTNTYNQATITCLNSFNKYALSKNAKVYFDFPCILKSPDIEAEGDFIDKQLHSYLKFECIGTPKEYMYPTSYFFDTPYHLNASGREARTDCVLSDLCKMLQKQGATVP